jgi:calcineurin-like phosphoesterase family protein
MDTYEELKERLAKEDELSILEILNISSEELVWHLDDLIYEKQDTIRAYYDETAEELDGEEESD